MNKTTDAGGVMRMHFVVTVIYLVLMLAACGSSPPVVQPGRAELGIPPTATTVDNTETIAITIANENRGSGVLVYNERTRAECKRRARPGSRIYRLNCDAVVYLDTNGGGAVEIMMRAPSNQMRVGK